MTITVRVVPANYLNRDNACEVLQPAVKVLVKTVSQRLGVEFDDVTMDVSYDYHRFDYQEPIQPPES